MTAAALVALAAVLGCGVLGWIVSLLKRDASIADVFWGPLFVVIAVTMLMLGSGTGPRRLLVLALVAAWAARLTWHLARRNLGQGEDARYRAMRAHHGEKFAIVSLFTVFLCQPLLAWIIAAPVIAVMQHTSPARLTPSDALGTLVFVTGFVLETLADRDLTKFKQDPANRERVLDRGLFRYSRHPNYFGEFVLWWGLGCFGLAVGSVASLVGPVLISVLLLRVSGVTLLESTIVSRRPDYARYQATTNAFFPGPPRRMP